jgi:hypothetical protein
LKIRASSPDGAVAKSGNGIADMTPHCASLDAGYARLSGQPMPHAGHHCGRAARALARQRARLARFVAAVSGRTHKRDSFAAPKTLPFNDFLRFAQCA